MKKLYTLLASISLASVAIPAQAELTITAPEVPVVLSDSIEAGNSYYLYNVSKAQFMNQNTNNNGFCGWSDTPYSFRLDESSNGYYAFWQGNLYIGGYGLSGNNIEWSCTSSATTSYVRFDLQKTDSEFYQIRLVEPNTYIGPKNIDYDYVYYNVSALYRDWLLIPATCSEEEVESCRRYSAKRKLYSIIAEMNDKGYYTAEYENTYNDETKTNSDLISLYLSLTNSLSITEANNYLFTSWSDYKVLITDLGGFYRESGYNHAWIERWSSEAGFTTTIKMSAYVDSPSTMVMDIWDNYWSSIQSLMPVQIYVDGELYIDYHGETYWDYYYDSNIFSNNKPSGDWYSLYSGHSAEDRFFFIDLEPGNHSIDIVYTDNYSGNNQRLIYIGRIGIEKTPSLSVNLASAGTLGDEVLRAMANNSSEYDYINIQNVRKLKVTGKMNDADWEVIHNMTSLFALDLSDAEITEIGESQLSRHYHSDLTFLHDLKLPKTLKKIGRTAFYRSHIDCEIPETVTEIGDYAFANTLLTKANLPNVENIGIGAFYRCSVLKNVELSDSLSSLGGAAFGGCYNIDTLRIKGTINEIPDYCFDSDSQIKECSIPESVTTIKKCAFYNCNNSLLGKLPDSLVTIGASAFYENRNASFSIPNTVKNIGASGLRGCWKNTDIKIDTLYLASDATYGESAFRESGISDVVISSNYVSLPIADLFNGCQKLESIKLLSPTKLTVASSFVSGVNKDDVTIYVPDYLWTTYMLDSYWKDFIHIESFDNGEIGDILLQENFALNQNYRFNGTPNIAIMNGVNFEIQGSTGMDLNDVTLWNNLKNNQYSQIMTTTDQIYVFGDAVERLYTEGNKWYFITLPFDCVLSRTENESGAKYAIRYYDGENRTIRDNFIAAHSDNIVDSSEYPYPESKHNYDANLNENSSNNKQTFTYPDATSLAVAFNSRCWVQEGPLNDLIHIRDAQGNETTYDGSELAGSALYLEGNSFEIWITSDGWGVQGYGYSIDAIFANINEEDVPSYLYYYTYNTSNWKKYDVANDIIPAGTGFVFMTSQDSWTKFYADDNPWKSKLFASNENTGNDIHIALQKNECVTSANRGWNLVGNPFTNYYNIHRINFSAPITLWTGTTYQAYSLHDDNIAIKPLQAMFVQCPDDADEISFPVAGRQLTSVIQDQTNAPMNESSVPARQIIDLGISLDSLADNTRVVLNEEASLSYETSCDASKFMSMDASVPQIYSCGNDGVNYAINERPVDNGVVQLGIYFPQSGTYTIHVSRNQAESVMLHDKQNDMMFNLADDDYEFHAEAGTDNSRFELIVERRGETGIETVTDEMTFDMNASAVYYDMNGRYAGREASELNEGVYMMRQNGKTQKVTIRQ